MWLPRIATLVLLVCPLATASAQGPKLLIAFASYRERPLHPRVYFYEHDGVGDGKIVGGIDAVTQRSDHRPWLSGDGRFCTFAAELENQTSRILHWDRKDKKLVDLPTINDSPNGQLSPSLSADGKRIVFSAWNRPGAGTRWNLLLYDIEAKKIVATPGLNKTDQDARMSAISGDGDTIAFVTSPGKGSTTGTDIALYDRKAGKLLETPKGLNSPNMDVEPTLNGDGKLVAFVSDRPGGKGNRDVWLYDRTTAKLVDLPSLNSAAHEQSPMLSGKGRFVVFVSERIKGAGERDVYLYDRKKAKLLPTPGLNSKTDDFDPCVMVIEGEE